MKRFSLKAVTGGAPAMTLLLLFGLNAADELDRVAFGVLLPEIRDWYGVSLTTALTLQTVATLLTIVVAAPVGFIADRTNRVRLIAAGAFIWGVMGFFTGIAPTLLILALARLGSGMAKTMGPAQASLLADSYPPKSRAGVFSFFGSADSVGRFIGPLAAGWLAGLATWQLPFFVFALPSIALGVALLVNVREPARGESEGVISKSDAPGFTESWRMANGVRSLRRIWWSLPFVVGGANALVGVLGLLLDDVFHVGAAGRGFLIAAREPFAIAGLLLGAVVGNR
jgi:branched-chain amino acid transport system ATP-binding protein